MKLFILIGYKKTLLYHKSDKIVSYVLLLGMLGDLSPCLWLYMYSLRWRAYGITFLKAMQDMQGGVWVTLDNDNTADIHV